MVTYFINGISDIVSYSFSDSTWIGLHDRDQESDFRWLNNVPLYYEKFAGAQPGGSTNENYVLLNNVLSWNDRGDLDRPYLCSSVGMYASRLKERDEKLPF